MTTETMNRTITELAVQYIQQEIADRGFDWLREQDNLVTAQKNLQAMGLGEFTIEVQASGDKNYFRMIPLNMDDQS